MARRVVRTMSTLLVERNPVEPTAREELHSKPMKLVEWLVHQFFASMNANVYVRLVWINMTPIWSFKTQASQISQSALRSQGRLATSTTSTTASPDVMERRHSSRAMPLERAFQLRWGGLCWPAIMVILLNCFNAWILNVSYHFYSCSNFIVVTAQKHTSPSKNTGTPCAWARLQKLMWSIR